MIIWRYMMRKVDLRMNELQKYKIIKKLVETDGNKHRAAIRLNCSYRTINRLIVKYKTHGKEGFVHGNRNSLPAHTFDPETKSRIIDLYLSDYSDANLVHFAEIVNDELGIKVSDTTINNWLKQEYVLSPKARRKTKKAMRLALKVKLDQTKSDKAANKIKESIAIIESNQAHPRRPRSKYFGEMIQMDASSFEWVPGEIWHLHLAVDDSTSKVVGAYFDTQETLKGYYNVFHQILTEYGIPAMFYTDRRTVFEYKRKNTAFDGEDTFTQFSYACHQLGVDIKTTSVAQAKGRIERMNQTFQSRLPVDLRRANITSIEAANEFLKSYLKKLNDKFALQLNSTKTVFETQPSIEKINQTLAVISPGKIDSGHCLKYKNAYYIPKTDKGVRVYFKNRTDGMVIEAFDGNLYVNILDNLYLLDNVPKRQKVSGNFDQDEPKKPKKKKQYIPPLSHPWKQASYMNYVARQQHRENGANI